MVRGPNNQKESMERSHLGKMMTYLIMILIQRVWILFCIHGCVAEWEEDEPGEELVSEDEEEEKEEDEEEQDVIFNFEFIFCRAGLFLTDIYQMMKAMSMKRT